MFSNLEDEGTSSNLTMTNKIEMLNQRATAIIREKDAEIARLNKEIDEAEQSFENGLQANVDENAELAGEIARLEIQLKLMDAREARELNEIRNQQNAEIEAIREKHQKELEVFHQEIPEKNEVDPVSRRNPSSTTSSLPETLISSSEAETTDVIPSTESSTELHINSQKQKAKETEKEVQRLEAELRRVTLFRQQQIAEQAQKLREKEEQQRKERRERQKKTIETQLGQKKSEYEENLAELRENLKKEADEMREKLERMVERSDQLDSQIAETLAENDEREVQLDRVRQAKHNSTLSYTGTDSPSALKKKGSPRVIRKKIREAAMFPEFSVLETEILRLRDENDELRRIIKRLDKLAYIRTPR